MLFDIFDKRPKPPRYSVERVQAIIDKFSGGKSPLKAQDFIKVAIEEKVPLDLMLAQAAAESGFGTKGRAVRTKNVFNIGNYTQGDQLSKDDPLMDRYSTYMPTWMDGLKAYARNMRSNYLTRGKGTQDLLKKFVNKQGQRYAADPDYESTLGTIMKGFGNLYATTPKNKPTAPVKYYTDQQLINMDPSKKNFNTLFLQRELAARGYKLPGSMKDTGDFDGILGQETINALNKFKQTAKLPYESQSQLKAEFEREKRSRRQNPYRQ